MPRRTARTQRMHAHLGALTSDRRKVAERRLVHGHRGRGAPLRSTAEIGEGVIALSVLSRVSSLAQCEADPDIAQCEADSLEGRGTTPCERRLVHWHRGRGAPLRSSRDRGRRNRPRRPQSSVQPRAERSRSRHRAMRSRFTRKNISAAA
jgi:hypothetical protein